MNNLLAQDFSKIQSKGLPGNTIPSNFANLIKIILPWIFYGSGFLLLIYLIFAGIQLMMSRGDPKAVAAAWSRITYAVIGFVIIFFAYFLTRILGMVLGVPDFKGVFI